MTAFKFADRYAEAGINPGPTIISIREGPAERIRKDLNSEQRYDLIGIYFGDRSIDPTWFATQFAADDASFSVVNNSRECVILAAAILGARVAEGDSHTIAAIVAASVAGKRPTTEAPGLIDEANSAFVQSAITARTPSPIGSKFGVPATTKLGEEIVALAANDWPALTAVLGKIRTEGQESAKALATFTTTALEQLVSQIGYMREETQMLWWLYGEASNILERPFSALTAGPLAIVAGMELAALATRSQLGPAAGPVLLERVLRFAKKEKAPAKSLASILDGFDPGELAAFHTDRRGRPGIVFPIMTAIEKTREIGQSSWYGAFKSAAGFDATTEFAPSELARQVYVECLLGRFQ
jgi:hypothetical protein